jgi:hypothetical protein
MKPEVMLELLETAADQLDIKVTYEPLQTAAIASIGRGGLCRLKGPNGMEWRVIVDKRATSDERIATLAASLARFDTSELELPQQVREVIALHVGTGPRRAA